MPVTPAWEEEEGEAEEEGGQLKLESTEQCHCCSGSQGNGWAPLAPARFAPTWVRLRAWRGEPSPHPAAVSPLCKPGRKEEESRIPLSSSSSRTGS